VRLNHASWALSTAVVEEGPFLDLNTNEAIRVSLDTGVGRGDYDVQRSGF
jgi:hypothetical protein